MKEYETTLTFDINETVANPNIYRDKEGTPAKSLQQSLIKQVNTFMLLQLLTTWKIRIF